MRAIKVLKNIWAQLHRFVFWALILALLWAWIYSLIGDAPRSKKLIVYVDACALDRRGLQIALEDACLPDTELRLIEVRSFEYDLFGSALEGDLYLMKESILKATLDESPEKLAALPLPDGGTGYAWEGKTVALLAFDPAAQTGLAMDHITYALPGEREEEAYWLCLDAQSPHLASQPGAADNAAWDAALALLGMRD